MSIFSMVLIGVGEGDTASVGEGVGCVAGIKIPESQARIFFPLTLELTQVKMRPLWIVFWPRYLQAIPGFSTASAGNIDVASVDSRPILSTRREIFPMARNYF